MEDDVLIISSKSDYKRIDYGNEGSIYLIDDNTVFKSFDFLKKDIIEEKFEKIELLKKIKDKNCAFPIKIVVDKDGNKIGYTMDYVKKLNGFYDITRLNYEKDKSKVLEYLIKLDKAIIRNRDRKILHGDFTNNNFLVDQSYNPIIVDTDSFAIGEYNLNPKIMILKYYKRIFGRNCSKLDNEIFTSSLMMMQCFINGEQIKFGDSEEYFKNIVNIFSFEKETKEILNAIFSDSRDKPYFGDALRTMKPHQLEYKKEDLYKIKRYK